MKNEHFGEELFAPGVARLTRHERRPPPNPNVLPQTSFRHATIGAGHRHNPCGCAFRQVRRRAPWLLTSWRRGRVGRLTAYPASVLLQEGNGHLLGASHGAATSPPPLREDPRLWWPGIGRLDHLRVDLANLLQGVLCSTRQRLLGDARRRWCIFGGVHAFLSAQPPWRGIWRAKGRWGGSSLGVLDMTGVAVGLHGCGVAGKRVVRWTPALLK
jgi:hypothetical protein